MSRNPAVILHDLTGSAIGVTGNRLFVSGSLALTEQVRVTTTGSLQTAVATLHGVEDLNNSTTVALGSNATFTGQAFDTLNYPTAVITVKPSHASATNGLQFQWSPDGTNWDISSVGSVDANQGRGFHLSHRARYFRVVYTNGSQAQSSFRLSVIHRPATVGLISRPIKDALDDDNFATTTRSVLAGKRPDSTYGNVPVSADNYLKVTISDIDPHAEDRLVAADKAVFGAGVVATRLTALNADFSAPIVNNDIVTSTSGGGTVTQSSGSLKVATGTGTTSSARAATSGSLRYAPGREIYVQYTAAFTTPTSANSHQRVGLYGTSGSLNNGFFIGHSGTGFGVTVRRDGIDTFTSSSAFSLDSLDGSSTSHFTRAGTPEALDKTKENVYRIRFGWLGAAPVFFEVMAPDGHWVTFHKILQPNLSTSPSITNPNLPVTVEAIKSSADSTNLVVTTSSWDAGTVESDLGLGPEDVRGNKYVTRSVASQTADATVYTVSPGRILKVTSLIIFLSNSSIATGGRLDVRDGAGGEIRVPFTVSDASSLVTATVVLAITFPTPLRFTNAVFADVVNGTLSYSITIVGYEVRA